MALLWAAVGLAWAGILGLPLLNGLIAAALLGAAMVIPVEVHNRLKLPATSNEELRRFGLAAMSASGLSLTIGKLGFFFSWVSLIIWGVVALIRSIL